MILQMVNRAFMQTGSIHGAAAQLGISYESICSLMNDLAEMEYQNA
jgi:molybdenum-dependent DNA-binding transcriptional regulator ModE